MPWRHGRKDAAGEAEGLGKRVHTFANDRGGAADSQLRSNIIAVMERNVAPETKRSLLKKDVTEFDKLCGEGDPDARAIFQAAVTEHPGDAAHAPAAASPAEAPSQRQRTAGLGVFGAPGAK